MTNTSINCCYEANIMTQRNFQGLVYLGDLKKTYVKYLYQIYARQPGRVIHKQRALSVKCDQYAADYGSLVKRMHRGF